LVANRESGIVSALQTWEKPAVRILVMILLLGISTRYARADVAPPGRFDNAVLLVAVASPFLFGFLILAIAHLHRKRQQRPSENAHDDT
jgi:hypothetical protein